MKATVDPAVAAICDRLWGLHDDFIDHPISVGEAGWQTLRRVVAFLATDLELDAATQAETWPFRNQAEWRQHEWLANELDLPEYDADVHVLQVNAWWNRVPTIVGILLLAGVLVASLVIGLLWT